MITIPAELIEDVRACLNSAFTVQEMEELVRLELPEGEKLVPDIVWGDSGKTIALNLVVLAGRKGILPELVEAMVKLQPRRSDIADLPALVRSALANVGSKPKPADELGEAVAELTREFQQKNELFQYLNAYKELHEILHELQDYFPKIEATAEARKANPSLSLAQDVVEFLTEHVKGASDSVKEIEFPERPPAWIAEFSIAVDAILRSDATMTRRMARMKKLPSDNLAALNEKLVENSSRLEPKKWVASLNGILAHLGPTGDGAAAKLRGEVEVFRDTCSKFDELIDTHNSCQNIDRYLQEAKGLASVAPKDLLEWDTIKESLDELASRRKSDMRVQRTGEAARSCDADNQPQALRDLTRLFDDLFMETDKALLKVTTKLLIKRVALQKALEALR